MAGDWIKLECATPRKPEVMRMAELLGISRRECMGLLIDFWTWLDTNARTENVPNLSRLCADNFLNCPGFAGAIESVGWVKWDDVKSTARVVNFDSHHSKSAKTRAYEQKKKQLQRSNSSRNCPPKTGTREEKRRVFKNTMSTATAIDLPSGFFRFWSAWPVSPRKVAKAKCLEVWKRKGLEEIAERIIGHVDSLKTSDQWARGYEPAPLTYLNQTRWLDAEAAVTEVRKWD